jgi:hypothetical protein
VWQYPIGKFKGYLSAILELRVDEMHLDFEVGLLASRGTEESVNEFRKTRDSEDG